MDVVKDALWLTVTSPDGLTILFGVFVLLPLGAGTLELYYRRGGRAGLGRRRKAR